MVCMRVHLPNSAFLGNIDPFLRTFDNSNPTKLKITANKKWISIHPVVLSMIASLGLTVKSSDIQCEKLEAASKHYLERMGLFRFLNIESEIVIKEHEPAGRFMENQFFKQLKIAFSIKKIQDSQILQQLDEKIPAISSITLYGSTAQGKDDEKSDIDLLIIGQKIKIDVSKYEKKINKEINLLIMKWSEWRQHANQDKPFYREIVKDGIALLGDIPVIE